MSEETYEQIRERHEREIRDWTRRVCVGGKSINAIARDTGVNIGTIWRLVKQHVRMEK